MAELPDSPPQDPQAVGWLGFVGAALAGCFAVIAWAYWRQTAEVLTDVGSPHSDATAFATGLPGIGLEFASYAVGLLAVITLGSVWLWRPAILRKPYSIASMVCLLPVVTLLALRMGWLYR